MTLLGNCSLHKAHEEKGRSCPSICQFLLNYWTDFDEIWYCRSRWGEFEFDSYHKVQIGLTERVGVAVMLLTLIWEVLCSNLVHGLVWRKFQWVFLSSLEQIPAQYLRPWLLTFKTPPTSLFTYRLNIHRKDCLPPAACCLLACLTRRPEDGDTQSTRFSPGWLHMNLLVKDMTLE
jgi:hypothetical protein